MIAASVYRPFDYQIIIGKQNINLLLAIVYESIDYGVPVIFAYYLYTCFVIFIIYMNKLTIIEDGVVNLYPYILNNKIQESFDH